MIKLRPYQNQAVCNALEMLVERGNSLIVAGTGAGKTIMLAETIRRYIKWFSVNYNKKPHVLVLVHRNEIHCQNHDKFSKVCPDIITSEITSDRKSLKGNVHFGMIQTVVNILPELERSNSYFDLIVIDECHHSAAASYETIIQWNAKGNRKAVILGVTATPNRGDKMPLVHIWDNYFQITTNYLIQCHYLVKPIFKDLSPVFQDDRGKREQGHLAKHIQDDIAGNELIYKMCEQYLEVKEPGKTVIFAPSHNFCKIIFDTLKKMGRNPAYISRNIDKETRKNEFKRFEEDETCQELINVDICTEGYDYPDMRNLVEFDTNGTHTMWVQKVGRVLRLSENKHHCTVIDFGGNIKLYPDGIETKVNLDGAIKKENGKRLNEDSFFEADTSDKYTSLLCFQSNDVYTPYNLPKGFETLYDNVLGVVTVGCGKDADCILINQGNIYILFVTDKENIRIKMKDTFEECLKFAIKILGNTDEKIENRNVSQMQIKLLAPDIPVMAYSWQGANCCICFRCWKNEVLECLKQSDISNL